MSTILIITDGKIANLDAIEAVKIAMKSGAWVRKPLPELNVIIERVIDASPIKIKVTELDSLPQKQKSICSCTFGLELVEAEATND